MQKKNHCGDHLAKNIYDFISNQLNYGLIYKMSIYYGNAFPHFLPFLVSDCETEQPDLDIDS